MTAALLAVWLGLPIAGCSRPPSPETFDSISVSRYACEHECRFSEVGLRRGGSAFSSDDDGNVVWVMLPHGAFERIANELASTPVFTGATDYRGDARLRETSSITVTAGRIYRRVVFPSLRDVVDRESDLGRLAGFVQSVSREIGTLAFKSRAGMRARLNDVARLAEVSYRAEGCYGTCPIYTATFWPDGHAVRSMRKPGSRLVTEAKARVAFARVIELLRASDFTYLAPQYRARTSDTSGSELRLAYRDGFTYRSNGPDSTSWPPIFRDMADRMDQLVRDTAWTPTSEVPIARR